MNLKDRQNPPPAWAIQVQSLSKSFGHRPVLKGIDLRIARGELVTILGPNGAGKTTLIRVLATLSRPTSGSFRIAGFDPRDNPSQVRRSIGVVTHQTLLYDELTAYENLKFYGRMYRLPNLEERIQAVIARLGLTSRLHDRVRTLSRGMQQRLSIARALLHDPPILLLDEPETGLDQHSAAALGEILSGGDGVKRTILMTTHNLERGLGLGDHIVILSEGCIVYEEAKRTLDLAALRRTYFERTGAGR